MSLSNSRDLTYLLTPTLKGTGIPFHLDKASGCHSFLVKGETAKSFNFVSIEQESSLLHPAQEDLLISCSFISRIKPSRPEGPYEDVGTVLHLER